MIELDEFKGHDFEELAERWGIKTDAVELISGHIMDSLYFHEDNAKGINGYRLIPAVKTDMLEFLAALIKSKEEHNYGQYIFVGLLLTAEEDDYTFATYFCTLLPHMWT